MLQLLKKNISAGKKCGKQKNCGRYDISEILLKVVLSTINLNQTKYVLVVVTKQEVYFSIQLCLTYYYNY